MDDAEKESTIEEALSSYLTGTGMESIDPAKFGAAMFMAGFNTGKVTALTEAADHIYRTGGDAMHRVRVAELLRARAAEEC